VFVVTALAVAVHMTTEVVTTNQ